MNSNLVYFNSSYFYVFFIFLFMYLLLIGCRKNKVLKQIKLFIIILLDIIEKWGDVSSGRGSTPCRLQDINHMLYFIADD